MNSYEAQQSYFETAYLTGTDSWTHSPWYGHIVSYLTQLSKEKIVLDVGCGRGIWDFTLGKMGFKVIGIDTISRVISINNQEVQARGFAGKIAFLEGSVFDIPLQDNSIGSVIDIGLLQHIDPKDWSQYIQEISRVLAPGGKVLISTLSRTTPQYMGFEPSKSDTGNIELFNVFHHFFTLNELQDIYKNFTLIHSSEIMTDVHGDPTHTLFALFEKKA